MKIRKFIMFISGSLLLTSCVSTNKVVKIENVWKKGNSIVSNGKKISCTSKVTDFSNKTWVLVKIKDSDLVRIHSEEEPDLFLHIENNELELGRIHNHWWSAKWAITNCGSYSLIQNMWKLDNFINIENNQLKSSPVEVKWHSSRWKIIENK